MKQFFSVSDVDIPLDELVSESLHLKASPFQYKQLGEFKTMGLVFLNPSLRTRMSTHKAAANLGMHVMVLNMDNEGSWPRSWAPADRCLASNCYLPVASRRNRRRKTSF